MPRASSRIRPRARSLPGTVSAANDGRLAPIAVHDQNPDPALEVTLAGDLVSYNPAAQRQFSSWHAAREPHPLLANWEPIQKRLRDGGREWVQTLAVGEKTYEAAFFVSPGADRVRLYAHDITHLKGAEQRLTQQLSESRTFYQISEMLASSLELPVVVQQIADAAVALVPQADLAVLHVLDASQSCLHAMAIAGKQTAAGRLARPLNFKIGQGIAGTVIATRQAINLGDAPADPRYVVDQSRVNPVRSLLAAPVTVNEQCLGTLSVQTARPNAFSPDDERLLTQLGTLAALALDKANLLKTTHDQLQEEQRMRLQLVQHEKLSVLGRLVASVAHELNNPLQAIQNALYLVGTDPGLSQQSRHDLDVATRETNRMADLVFRLRDTYRPTARTEFKRVVLTDLLNDVLQLLGVHFRRNNIAVAFTPPSSLPAQPLVPDHIKQVLINLCLNAAEAMPSGGTLTITLAPDAGQPGTRMTFTDTGPGIAPEALPHIFDPFFTTKPGGTGLGLAISYDIVAQHKGTIDVASQVGLGSTFTLWLPDVQPSQPEPLPIVDALSLPIAAPFNLAPANPVSGGGDISP